MKTNSTVKTLAGAATILALCVVILGAYVRLSDAGLGCPDWPGCYGKLVVPSAERAIDVAAQYERPFDSPKAWKEMAHRYLAGALGLLILALAVVAWRRRGDPNQSVLAPTALLLLVIAQAALGMWTVTLLLQPAIVLAHLIGGFATVCLCAWIALRSGPLNQAAPATHGPVGAVRPWLVLGIGVLIGQILLGGWTSTNYAALACPDFPTCHGSWWPAGADFAQGFEIWREAGLDHEGGRLPGEARVAIHVAHRVGAVVAFLYICALGIALWRRAADRRLKIAAAAALTLLGLQVALGVSNVVLGLPLAVAVAHNGVAALLLLSLVLCVHHLWPRGEAEIIGTSSTHE